MWSVQFDTEKPKRNANNRNQRFLKTIETNFLKTKRLSVLEKTSSKNRQAVYKKKFFLVNIVFCFVRAKIGY